MANRRLSDFVAKPYDCHDIRKAADILDKDFDLLEVQFRVGRKSDYASMLCLDLEKKTKFVCNCGGLVVVKKIKEVTAKSTLPLTMKIVMVNGKTGSYMDIQ
jgi:predicted patatin/cPLA2 family phospholipase